MSPTVTTTILPLPSPPPGCSPSYKGSFDITPANVSSSNRRDLEKRGTTTFEYSLSAGIRIDAEGRIGVISSSEQLEFYSVAQTGASYSSGFTVCKNGSVALGNTAIWYLCPSDGAVGIFIRGSSNQCIQSFLVAQPLNSSDGPIPVAASSTTMKGITTHSTNSPSPTSSQHSHTLSSGAQAGIGVSAALIGLALRIAALWFIFRRRRHALKRDLSVDWSKPELHGEDIKPPVSGELEGGENSVEVAGSPDLGELHGHQGFELE